MSIAIRIDRLSKRYRIGGRARYGRLTEALTKAVASSFRRARAGGGGDDFIWALDDVSLEINEGEAFGVIGANGAGKTTLLRILSRITEPTRGYAEITGRVGSLLEVGTGFHPELSGRENIFLNGAILGMRRSKITRQFDEIVSFAGMERFIDTPLKHYSSGMAVRLAFSVAAHLEPEILLVDEVLAVGDADFQAKSLAKMEGVAGEGRTVVFVSHNLAAVRRLCSRACLIGQGKIVEQGDPSSVIDKYHRLVEDRSEVETGARTVAEGSIAYVSWRIPDADDPHITRSGDPCRIRLRLVARRSLRNAIFGFALWTEDGTLAWTTSSRDHGQQAVALEAGDHDVEFSVLTLPLRPGIYEAQASVITQTDGVLDSWYLQPRLKVLPAQESTLPRAWQGVLHLPGGFNISSASASDAST